jgi:serine-type D-Ala-D-Ala carboxypeptidase/endopeptidase
MKSLLLALCRASAWSFASALVAGSLFAQSSAPTPFPPDSEIRQMLADRVGDPKRGVAVVVGLIDASGRRVVSYGSVARDDPRPVDGATVFEIGSITKVFTSLVLMDMVGKGEIEVTDPVARFLPPTAHVPERNGRQITLQDLATQSSGLPRMPTNFGPKDRANPYADYTPDQLYAFLGGYELSRDIGSEFEYSNLGVGLLGHALALRDKEDYETMVRRRVLAPLGMKSTAIALTPEMKSRLAIGHTAKGEPTANWDIAVLAGAGGLRSTADDMLTFLGANLGYEKTPLAAAMAAQLGIRRPAGGPNAEIAYNWFVQTRDGHPIVWHNGGTGGYRSFAGFDPKARRGVVVLTNISSPIGGDDLGRHLLNPNFPLAKTSAPKDRVAVAVDPKTLGRYVGAFQLAPRVVMTITQEGDQLFGQITGQEKYPMFAEAEDRFFLKITDAQVTFAREGEGPATSATLHQGGRDTVAQRIDEAKAAEIAAQRGAPGAEKALRRNIEELRAGKPNYELMSPGLARITRQQLTGLKKMMEELGAVESVTYKRPGGSGADVFEIKFEHGTTEWRIGMESEEKIASVGVRRL